eukprot:SAG25_NODE_592_length_6685_cov_34.632098_4_plen_85_part_00
MLAGTLRKMKSTQAALENGVRQALRVATLGIELHSAADYIVGDVAAAAEAVANMAKNQAASEWTDAPLAAAAAKASTQKVIPPS